jgi:acetyltransferase-like isoleucine patch superfamily enzyme
MVSYPNRGVSLEPIREYLINPEVTDTAALELGFVWTTGTSLLTFATTASFVEDASSRSNVAAILVDSEVSLDRSIEDYGPQIVFVRNARLNFFRLHNSLRPTLEFPPSTIHKTSKVHPNVVIDDVGVEIGKNCVIEPGVTIQRGTTIGESTVIRAGCHLGSDALDIKDGEDGNPVMTDHLGGVSIGSNVEIGHNSVVDRSIFRQTTTTIGDFTKIGCLSNISHGVQIGTRNKIAAGVKICGSTVVGDENWIGPGAIISNLLSVGSRNYVALGAQVLSNLEDDWKVVGIRVFKDRKLF